MLRWIKVLVAAAPDMSSSIRDQLGSLIAREEAHGRR
jgi:hypothetical protein